MGWQRECRDKSRWSGAGNSSGNAMRHEGDERLVASLWTLPPRQGEPAPHGAETAAKTTDVTGTGASMDRRGSLEIESAARVGCS